MRSPLLARSLAFAAGSTVAVVAVIGCLHLPMARPLLTALEAWCPVLNVPATQVESMQATAAGALRGTAPAPSRESTALRLVFGSTADVDAWTHARSFGCDTESRGFEYRWCRRVPASALGRLDVDAAQEREVVIARDSQGRTRAVDILARTTAGAAATTLARTAAHDLQALLGEPTDAHGSFEADALAAPFGSASMRYAFSDVVVTLTATNIPGSGVAVREQYLAMNW